MMKKLVLLLFAFVLMLPSCSKADKSSPLIGTTWSTIASKYSAGSRMTIYKLGFISGNKAVLDERFWGDKEPQNSYKVKYALDGNNISFSSLVLVSMDHQWKITEGVILDDTMVLKGEKKDGGSYEDTKEFVFNLDRP